MAHIYVCGTNYVYTISKVLNSFICLATQKMTYAHLKGKEKWGKVFPPSNQTMAQILAALAAVLAPGQQL